MPRGWDSWVETVSALDLSGLSDCRIDYTIENRGAPTRATSASWPTARTAAPSTWPTCTWSTGANRPPSASPTGSPTCTCASSSSSNDLTADGVYLDDLEVHCIDPALPADLVRDGDGHVIRLAAGGRGRRAAPLAASGRAGRPHQGRDPRRGTRPAATRGQGRRQPRPRRPRGARPAGHPGSDTGADPAPDGSGRRAPRPAADRDRPAHSPAAPLRGSRSALVPSADGR